jgi:putative PIN family toxin of toxin-antitoxin system
MLRVFIDTSVLYAALHSSTGASHELFRLALNNECQIVISESILTEAERNISKDIPDYLPVYQALLTALEPEILPLPPPKLVRSVEAYVVPKDAPIVAAAIQAQPDYLASLDKKHILKLEFAKQSGLTIVRPEIVVWAMREERNLQAA